MPLSPRRPVFDANASTSSFGDLPEWNLSDLYTAPDAPELTRDLGWLKQTCAGFAATYEGKLATLDSVMVMVEHTTDNDGNAHSALYAWKA